MRSTRDDAGAQRRGFATRRAPTRGLLHCVAAVVVMLSAGTRVADAASIVLLDYGEADAGPHAEWLRQALGERLIQTQRQEETAAIWRQRVRFAPDETQDAYLLDSTQAIASAREAFFAGDFQVAADTLMPRLHALTANPEFLAFHPDLVVPLQDAFVLMAQGLDLAGDSDSSALILHEIAELLRFAPATTAAVSPNRVDAIEALKRELALRVVQVSWQADEPCEVYINGSPAGVTSHGEIRVPAREVFAQLRCATRESFVYSIAADAEAFLFDIAFDAAVSLRDGVPVLRPRSSTSPDLLRRVIAHAAAVLDVEEVYGVAVAPGEAFAGSMVEISRWQASQSSFRAIRLPVHDATAREDVADALSYVQSGEPTRSSLLWQEVPGWVVYDDGTMTEDERSAVAEDPNLEIVRTAPNVIVVPVETLRNEAPARRGMALIPGLLALGATGVGTYFALEASQSNDALASCSDLSNDACRGSERAQALRDDLNRNRAVEIAAFSSAGVLAVTTAAMLIARRDRGGRRVDIAPVVDIESRGAGAVLAARF